MPCCCPALLAFALVRPAHGIVTGGPYWFERVRYAAWRIGTIFAYACHSPLGVASAFARDGRILSGDAVFSRELHWVVAGAPAVSLRGRFPVLRMLYSA